MSVHGVDILYSPERPKLVVPRPKVRNTVRWLCLQYADDIALVCTSQEGVRNCVSFLATKSALYGLKINASKTVLMATSYDNTISFDQQIEVNGQQLETVDHFCYLGATVGSDKGSKAEIAERINKASRAFFVYRNFWKRSAIDVKTRIDIFNAVVMSVLLYGAATWNTNRPSLKRLEAFQYRCLMIITNMQRDAVTRKLPALQHVLDAVKS
eukprot:Lankesteria_metandrocarpae@DN5366_c0_g1_i10.p1